MTKSLKCLIVECMIVFRSDRLLLSIDRLEDKSEYFQREISILYKSIGINKWKIESYSGLICRPYKPDHLLALRDRLVIGCDSTFPLEFYHTCETASTVVLLAHAHEVGKLEEAGLSEVNAEAYINFYNSQARQEGREGQHINSIEGGEGGEEGEGAEEGQGPKVKMQKKGQVQKKYGFV